ncbi:MAG: DNA-processing protein DprA [Paracoccaceae bacterium]|nr:DNA-processing protein DprA [Paracoccaceae bacterium]
MAEHGHAAAALEALPEIARASGAKDYAPCPRATAEAEIAAARRAGARLVCFGDAAYPLSLMEIPDPPPLLWALGDTGLLARPAVALVGARNASSLGLRMAKALARGLGEAGQVVASGLARGIDTAAHTAALPTGTIAVTAGGVDAIYPAENAELAAKIGAEGLIISEQPMGLEPQARHFPRRNRIVSGLSRAVVVVEAAAKSGSLITARMALDQGREVMAVPGHPFDARASGCNMLIRDGATLVRGADDVLTALGETPVPRARRSTTPPPDHGPDEAEAPAAPRRAASTPEVPPAAAAKPATGSGPLAPRGAAPPAAAIAERILALLGPSPVAEDQLLRDLGLPPQAVAEELLGLELDGRVERRPGGLLALPA